MVEEIWKDIEGYDGRYKVSNYGRVISTIKEPPGSIYQTLNNCGYKQVQLIKDGKTKHMYVHRLVAYYFVDGYAEGMEVNHKDLNKTNNYYENLEWVSHSENQKHQRKLHGIASGRGKYGRKCHFCKGSISNGAKMCKPCLLKQNEEKNQKEINKEQLSEDLLKLSMNAIGRKYHRSDNTMRKICKKYGLPARRSEILEFRNKQKNMDP